MLVALCFQNQELTESSNYDLLHTCNLGQRIHPSSEEKTKLSLV